MTPDPNEHGTLKGYPDTVSDRAAIIEYMANVPRDEAEWLAVEAWEREDTNLSGAASASARKTGSAI